MTESLAEMDIFNCPSCIKSDLDESDLDAKGQYVHFLRFIFYIKHITTQPHLNFPIIFYSCHETFS